MKAFLIIIAIVLVIGVVMVGADFVKGVVATIRGDEVVETTTENIEELPAYICLKGGRFRGHNYSGTKYYYLIDTANKKSYYIASDISCKTGSVTINEDNTVNTTISFDLETNEYKIFKQNKGYASDGWYITVLGEYSATKRCEEVSIEQFVNMWNHTVDYKDLNVKKLTVEQFK